jgi:hypothetical protein
MKRAVVILLVILLLATLLPVGMGMSSTVDCPACVTSSPMTALALCLAILASVVTVVVRPLGCRMHLSSSRVPQLLLARSIDRPPQLV